VVIILNSGAGGAAHNPGATRSRIAALFCAVGLYPQIIVAEGKGVDAIALQAVAGNEETIIAAGGDGTVSAVAAEVAGTRTRLGVLPLGTLKHFARELRNSVPSRGRGARSGRFNNRAQLDFSPSRFSVLAPADFNIWRSDFDSRYAEGD
jgi:Diacylglycerol kinase catalytic domain